MEKKKYAMWLASFMNAKLTEQLLAEFGDCEEVYGASERELRSLGASERLIEKFTERKRSFDPDKETEKVQKIDGGYITRWDEDFPEGLRGITDEPLGFYYIGDIGVLKKRCVSIVGTRRLSDYGAVCTEKISGELAKRDVCIVSGMAIGTDGAAHRAALDNKGKTVGVLGTGIDVNYPQRHESLRRRVLSDGCLISEYPMGTAAFPANFPYRNRIISALSEVTIVIEAAKRSGSMLTAGHALAQGRTVMAVPGNITSSLSEGTNALIRDGAPPVTRVEDVLEELGIFEEEKKSGQKNKIILETDEKKVYDCIRCGRIGFDELVEKTNMNVQQLQFILTMLELKGAISKGSGQSYICTL